MAEVHVYHAKRDGFAGNRLYPLNALKERMPEIYSTAVRKYEGREWLLNLTVPGLNALWNDVIHFSLMHPRLIHKTLSQVGFGHHNCSLTWFEIPLADVLRLPATLYLNTRLLQDTRTLETSDFEVPRPERVRELSGMPDINLKYYRECFAKKEMPLLWKRAPHLLAKGDLDITAYRSFDWNAP